MDINRKTILDLKDKYWNLYYTDINDYEFMFRELNRAEYRKVLRSFDNPLDQEEYICEICILEPEQFDFENCPAGLPTILCSQILFISGFSEDASDVLNKLEMYREEMNTFDNQISCVIHEAFPSLSLDEIEGWPLDKTLWYFSRSEYIIEKLRGIELEMKAVDQEEEEEVYIPKKVVKEQPQEIYKDDIVLEGGTISDFPELAAIKRFKEGKLFND